MTTQQSQTNSANQERSQFDDVGVTVFPIDSPDDKFTDDEFHIIRETLSRIGLPGVSKETNTKKLVQTCHILHKKGKYKILHFKELFKLDGKPSSLTEEDVARRNKIALMLEEWELFDIHSKERPKNPENYGKLKVLSHKEKNDWIIETKYSVGKPINNK